MKSLCRLWGFVMSHQRSGISVVAAQSSRAGSALHVAVVGLCILTQGCSSTQSNSDTGGSSKLWGNDRAASARPLDPPPPAGYDADGPAPTYRGGRDPVTQRAQQWPPASPHQPTAVDRAALTPLPAAAPSSAPPSSGPASQRTAYAPPPASYPAGAPPRGTAAGASSVEVKPGDTLYRIAKANNVSVPALMQANSLSAESIKVGQQLTIPGR